MLHKTLILLILSGSLRIFNIESSENKKIFSLPLFKAAVKNDINLLKTLISSGEIINQQNEIGFTPLHTAIYYKKDSAVKLLLEQGADTEITDDEGITPLWLATSKEYITGMQLLLLHGANFWHRHKNISILEHVTLPMRHHLLKELVNWGTWPKQSFLTYISKYLPHSLKLTHLSFDAVCKNKLINSLSLTGMEITLRDLVHYAVFCLSIDEKKHFIERIFLQSNEQQRTHVAYQTIKAFAQCQIKQWREALSTDQELSYLIDSDFIEQRIERFYFESFLPNK